MDIAKVNEELRSASPEEIIRWATSQGKRVIASTSFSPKSAVMLNLVSQVDKSIPVVWVDSGYNVRDTYLVAEQLINRLSLDIRVYIPEMTAERRNALMGGIPQIDNEELHREFTRQVKLEPFSRAVQELQPEIWLTGIRQDETDFRKSLDIVSYDGRGILKVAPVFYWSEQEMDDYIASHELPVARRYFDPTKVLDRRECGLHTAA
jgi:phosphoadenosine phosphosulfate reductase